MKLSLIAAMDENKLIGSAEGGLPWQGIEQDRDHFRSYVEGKALLLGRKTFEEMKGWFDTDHRPYILTRDRNYVPGISAKVAFSFDEVIIQAEKERENELVVCGGAAIYERAIDSADLIILTILHSTFIVQSEPKFFPKWDSKKFIEISRQEFAPSENNDFGMSIVHLQS
ncbi:MAG: dihydrofolate reductase [Verrucomicrobiales bacterium]